MTERSGASLNGWAPRPFRASWWARGPHLQTLAGKFLRRPADPGLVRERWETPDGDFLDLDFAPEPGDRERPPAGSRAGTSGPVDGLDPAGRPVVLVLHGLEGSARRPYALLAYRALSQRGIRAVGLNFRSCGGEPNRTARFYHSGETGDLSFVLERLRERFPGRPLGALGFSLGGNVLLKHLGERGEGARELLSAAAAISVPFDLAAGCDLLGSTRMGRIYTRYFVRSLLDKAEAKVHLIEKLVHLDRLRAARTLRHFDDAATAPIHGFEDADHYYRVSSSAGYVDRIRLPTLVLHARDDPFLPAEAIPLAALRSNPCLRVVVTERGGHVGFLHGPPWAPRFWAEEEAARFLAEILGPS